MKVAKAVYNSNGYIAKLKKLGIPAVYVDVGL